MPPVGSCGGYWKSSAGTNTLEWYPSAGLGKNHKNVVSNFKENNTELISSSVFSDIVLTYTTSVEIFHVCIVEKSENIDYISLYIDICGTSGLSISRRCGPSV